MKTKFLLICMFLLRAGLCVLAEPAETITIVNCDFESEQSCNSFSKSPVASVQNDQGNRFLQISSNTRNSGNTVERNIDLTPYRGKMISIQAKVRAENVSKPEESWNGIKMMLHYKTESGGKQWPGARIEQGSFDWKTISFITTLPDDIENAALVLGLQDSTGCVYFDDIRITLTRRQIIRHPAPAEFSQPAFKGHSLPRLRGAMSGSRLSEEDTRTFAEDWGGNLFRFQINRNWHKANDNRDIAEYNQWIDSQLERLDTVLALCRKYGVYVAVDLHAPPGGRYADRSMAMFYEQIYADEFIRVWEKIARHCRGNPVIWAYDLVNEPAQNLSQPEDMNDFWELQEMAARAIRRIEPAKAIIFEVFKWDSPEGFDYVKPIDMTNIIYQAHMYKPGHFTHQGIGGNPTGVRYPGIIKGIEENRSSLRKYLEPVRRFQQAYNVHIYIGEFSAARWAPGAELYLNDVIEIFEEYGWDWSYHAYREAECWSLEHVEDKNSNKTAEEPTERFKVLKKWYSENKKAKFD